MMPVVFIFSAMVSGIAVVLLLYMFSCWYRKQPIDMRCVDTIALYLFYTFIIDFSLEMLDLVHRIYEADNPFAASISWSIPSLPIPGRHSNLYRTLVPIGLLALTQLLKFGAKNPQANLYRVRKLDAHRNFRHALERGNWWPAFFKEFRLHDLQDEHYFAGRITDCHRPLDPSALHSVAPGEAPATVAGENSHFDV